jgi:RNA polymerase sigma-70 factor (ECF subfamily)
VGESWDESAAWGRALGQDPRAFASIFDKHEDRVFRHSLHLTESFHDAEDVTAASFFELWRRRDRVRLVDDSTLPWLLVTATNLARNSGRSLRRYRRVLSQLPRSDSEQPNRTQRDPSQILGNHEDLYAAIRGLHPTDGSLLLLTAVEGMQIKEASHLLGITEGAGRVRLHRAKQRLRSRLEPEAELLAEGKSGTT